MDGKIKAPPPAGRMWLDGLEIFGVRHTDHAGAVTANTNNFNSPSAIHGNGQNTLSHERAGR